MSKAIFWIGLGIFIAAIIPADGLVIVGIIVMCFAAFCALWSISQFDSMSSKEDRPKRRGWFAEWMSGNDYSYRNTTPWVPTAPEFRKVTIVPLPEEDLDAARHRTIVSDVPPTSIYPVVPVRDYTYLPICSTTPVKCFPEKPCSTPPVGKCYPNLRPVVKPFSPLDNIK